MSSESKDRSETFIISLYAISVIGLLEAVALVYGVDGYGLALSVSGITGIAGVKLGGFLRAKR